MIARFREVCGNGEDESADNCHARGDGGDETDGKRCSIGDVGCGDHIDQFEFLQQDERADKSQSYRNGDSEIVQGSFAILFFGSGRIDGESVAVRCQCLVECIGDATLWHVAEVSGNVDAQIFERYVHIGNLGTAGDVVFDENGA